MQPRLGPRPLPLHLGTALMTWASSESAWKLWKPGSPSSNPGRRLLKQSPRLLPEIAALEARRRRQFEHALHREIGRRMDRLAEGVLAYRRHPFHRDLETPPPSGAKAIRACSIMARTHRRRAGAGRARCWSSLAHQSLGSSRPHRGEEPAARHGGPGLRPYLVDWGTPDADERRVRLHGLRRPPRTRARLPHQAGAAGAGSDGLLHGRHAHGGAGRAPAAARRRPRAAGRALGLPCRQDRPRLPAVGRTELAQIADQVGELPVDILQTLFWSLDPWLAVKKFGRFLGMDPQAPRRASSCCSRIG